MRKRIILLLICVLLTAGSFDAAAHQQVKTYTEEEALITSFKSTGADVLESTISGWTKLNDRFLTIGEIEAEMSGIINRINPEDKTVEKREESDSLNKMVLYGSKGNKSYNIAIESIKQETGGETYIVFDISLDRSYEDLEKERKAMADAVQRDSSRINFSSCIIGTYQGMLEERDADKKTKTALQAINAKKVEGIENEELKSISAFSTNVGGYVMSDQARVNVQLAMRYSSYDDKTYIWIGTPLIPMGY